jgi:hypothetical protein
MGPAGLSQFGSIPTSFTLAIAPTRRTSCSEWLYLKKVNTCVYEPSVFRVLVILATVKGEKQKRGALLCVWVGLRRALDQRF